MIQIESTVYPLDKQKQILDWLQQPACNLFLAHLRTMSAKLTADAGNLLVRGEQSDMEDAKEAAESARRLNDVIEIIQTIKGEKLPYQFEGIDLKAMPVVEIIEPATPDAN